MSEINESLFEMYFAFEKYRERLSHDKEHREHTAKAAKALSDGTTLTRLKREITVKEDWIDAIQQALPYFSAAISENRQFIDKNGNVVPIEKVKKVSKESVEHLSRHVEYLKDRDELKPDRIFVKENDNNYAVYENRFLYTALAYVRDFTDVRYTELLSLGDNSGTELDTSITFSLGEKNFTYTSSLTKTERSRGGNDDPYSKLLERIEKIRYTISDLLSTRLMLDMSKEPMIKPPVTVTNVLKSDSNFKEVWILYTKLNEYKDKEFYTVSETRDEVSAVPSDFYCCLSEVPLLMSGIADCHADGLTEEFKETALLKNLSEKNGEAKKHSEFVNKLKERLNSENEKQYIAALEEYIRIMSERDVYANEMEKKQSELYEKIKYLNNECRSYQARYENAETALKHAEEENERRIFDLNGKHDDEIKALSAEHCKEMQELSDRISNVQNALKETEDRLALSEEHKALSEARLVAIRRKYGETDITDYTIKENFDALEAEKNAFDKFFDDAWKKTKKKIFKECLKKKKR